MAFLFYILGWLAILGGAAWSGYMVYLGISTLPAQGMQEIIDYVTRVGLATATPGMWYLFCGLLLLAVGGVLSRLDEIAYNTRQG